MRVPETRNLAEEHERQVNRESGSLILAGALDADAASVQLHQTLDDREPKSQAAITACRRRIALTESIENVGQEIRQDADARVANADLDMRINSLKIDLYRSALWGELDRVGNQVPHDLLKT